MSVQSTERIAHEPASASADGSRSHQRWKISRSAHERILVTATQLVIVAVVLACWEYLPKIGPVRNLGHVFDPVFISSPSAVAQRLYDVLFGGASLHGFMWRYIGHTVGAAVVGLLLGLVLGGALGLVVGNWRFLGLVFRPFAVALNVIPR